MAATQRKPQVGAYYTDGKRLVLVTAEKMGGGYAIEDAMSGVLSIIDREEFEASWRRVEKEESSGRTRR